MAYRNKAAAMMLQYFIVLCMVLKYFISCFLFEGEIISFIQALTERVEKQSDKPVGKRDIKS